MNAYDIALFFHVIGLIALFGGFVIYVRAGTRLREATDMEQVRSWLGLLESSSPMFASGTVPWTVITGLNGLALGVVFVMTTKPGWAGSIGVAAVAAAIGAAGGARLTRRTPRAAISAQPAKS